MKKLPLPKLPSAELLADVLDLEYIKVCSKEVTVKKDGKVNKFTAFFGYRKLFDAESKTFVDVMTPAVNEKGESIMVSKSFRIILDDEVKAKLVKENSFPYILAVSLESDDYFVTIDKDPQTKEPRLDKNGKKHKIVGIRGYRELLSGLSSMSLDDLDEDVE